MNYFFLQSVIIILSSFIHNMLVLVAGMSAYHRTDINDTPVIINMNLNLEVIIEGDCFQDQSVKVVRKEQSTN